jgi:hypothetical protein
MFNSVTEEIQNIWQTSRAVKQSEKGWLSANAVCCQHNGEKADTRRRGGMLVTGEGVVNYHCFNCGYKANYTPGRHLNYKMRKLLSWMGADDLTVKRLIIDAIRVRDLLGQSVPDIHERKHEEITFKHRELPANSTSFGQWDLLLTLGSTELPDVLFGAAKYLDDRGGDILSRYEFYTTETTAYNLHRRVIIPMIWKGEIIGYTARAIDETVKPKYHSNYEPNVVFNVDKQLPSNEIVVVVEGPFDAMAIDGVAILGSECSEVQADIIDALGKRVIVVPDADRAGMKLVDNALEYGWHVSFPPWFDRHKDVSNAVKQYGRLFVLKTIIDSAISNKLRIELLKKKYK